MTPAARLPRLLLAALAIAGVGLLQLLEIFRIATGSPPDGIDPCSLDLFGLRFPPNGDGCYIQIGLPALFALAALVLAVALAARPSRVARLAAVVSGVAFVLTIPGVLSQFDVFTAATFEAALLGAATFLIAVPSGANGSAIRRRWIAAIVGCVGLGVFDFMFSGFLYAIKPMPQVGFFIVAASIAGGGWLASRLERLEAPSKPSAPAEASAT